MSAVEGQRYWNNGVMDVGGQEYWNNGVMEVGGQKSEVRNIGIME
jgi:hypothetical protein